MCTVRVPEAGRSRSGFTLFEVVIALAILSLLGGMMFFIVQSSVQAASEIEIVQRENRRVERFLTLCRNTFSAFPKGARVELRIVEREPLIQELIIHGAPESFVWGAEPISDGPLTLSLRRPVETTVTGEEAGSEGPPVSGEVSESDESSDEKPEFFLAMTRPGYVVQDRAEEEVETAGASALLEGVAQPDEDGRYWFPLLPDVRSMKWQFYEPGKKRWRDHQGAGRPPLIELTLEPFERPTPIRVVFRLN
ncbi:MAG: prepilin-type N-terminal cleavage/methylation domain-containing protein [Verrucomicrobiota bacterium]